MQTFPLPARCGAISALCWDPGGQMLAGVSDEGFVLLWHVASGELVFARRLSRSPLSTVAWSEHGRYLAFGGVDQTVSLLDWRTGAQVFSHVLDAPVCRIAFAPRGKRLLVAAGARIMLYSETRWNHPTILAQPSTVRDVSWSPTGGRFAAVCDYDVFVYNVVRRRTVYTLSGAQVGEARTVAWHAGGREVAVGTATGTVSIRDASSGEALTTYTLTRSPIAALCWGHVYMAVVDASANTALWDLLPREQSGLLARQYHAMQQVAFSPSGELLAMGTRRHVCVTAAEGTWE
jgi:WD40 repeat protein